MVTLELTEEQARIVSVACEFYARVRMGQFLLRRISLIQKSFLCRHLMLLLR